MPRSASAGVRLTNCARASAGTVWPLAFADMSSSILDMSTLLEGKIADTMSTRLQISTCAVVRQATNTRRQLEDIESLDTLDLAACGEFSFARVAETDLSPG